MAMTIAPKHRKLSPKRKPFIVQAFDPKWRSGRTGWLNWGRYATLERAQQAVSGLQKSHSLINWQFRVKEY